VSVACCVCKRVLIVAGPAFPVSHTVGVCCWDVYRAELGLKPKPFPAEVAA
jgi:hypothetical protein